jgi:aminopeptidase N
MLKNAAARVQRAQYQAPAYLLDRIALEFDLDLDTTEVYSTLHLRRNPAVPRAALELDGEQLELVGLELDGHALDETGYQLDGDTLRIGAPPLDAFVLRVRNRIHPRANTSLMGMYVSNGSLFTQCEAEGMRRITWIPDRPDVLARYTVLLRGSRDQFPVLLSNGNLVESGELSGARHFARWEDPFPKPSYLFAVVAARLASRDDTIRTCSGREVLLQIWAEPADLPRLEHAAACLRRAVAWDETRFGRELDLDRYMIVATADFNMGAMENKGLNIFNAKYVLADPEIATDTDFATIESIIGHEYFHNWSGNRVTCRDWFQLSLKEGLTVYRDQEFSADQSSRAVKRIGDVRGLRAAQFREDSGPLAHPVQPTSYQAIDNFYTATIYNKGAEVIRMMATIIGKPAFRRGMDLYFARHDNNAVTIDDFVQAMQDASGTDLTDFKLWYHQAGTPELTVTDEFDAETKRYALTVTQETKPTPGQPDKKPQVIPLAMGLLDGNGQELATRLDGEPQAKQGTRVLLATQAKTRFEFIDVASPPVPSLLRGFSAPVKLSGLSPDRLRFLAAHDTDPFVRWESGQQFATSSILEMVAAIQQGRQPEVDPALIEAASAAIDQEPAFAAEALSLPGEAGLADRMTVVDVEAIHTARDMARTAIGQAIGDKLRATYEALTDTGPYTTDGPAIGRRSLRNTCLAYLVAGHVAGAVKLAKAQFDAGQNMTDVLAALSVLSAVDCDERLDALAAFYQAWRNDPLVLDKWFAIQALSPLPDTVKAVAALKSHSDFDLRNPNRIRALVSSFAANQVRFHDASGAGYKLYADTLIQLDPANGQVAARMVSPLGQWRRFDATRQALMRAQLQRILDLPGLSRNTFEMASKSLA